MTNEILEFEINEEGIAIETPYSQLLSKMNKWLKGEIDLFEEDESC